MFLSGDSQEDANGASSSSFFILFFSGGPIHAFGVDHIPFSSFQIPSHAGVSYIHSCLAIQLFRSAQDIPKIRAYTLLSFKLFRDCYLILAI